MNLVTALQHTVAHRSTGMVFLHPGGREERLTYAGLQAEALQVLGGLQARGLEPGNEVVLQCEDNRTFLTVFWACLMGGLVPVPLSGGTQAEQKRKFFQVWNYLARPFLFCDEAQKARLASLAQEDEGLSMMWAQMEERYLAGEALLACETPGTIKEAPEGLAYVQFSSGSTGDPKGVRLTHENLLANTKDISQSLEMREGDVLLNWMPLTHDMGMIGFHLLGVCEGLEAVCLPTPVFIRRPLLWMEVAAAHRASVLYAPNFGLQYFLTAFEKKSAGDWDLSGVRILVNGAEAISAPLCNRFEETLAPYGWSQHAIVAAYGLAEASVEVSASKPGSAMNVYRLDRRHLTIGDRVVEVVPGSLPEVSFVEVGTVVGSCRLRICGDDDQPLESDTVGHIQISGRNVTAGYYGNAAATQKLFTGDGWLRTGDLGFLHEGKLVVTGRYKNIIIVNGQNYYPQDIELALVDEGLVEQGKVVACGLRTGGSEQLIVFVLFKGTAEAFEPVATSVREAVLRRIGIAAGDVVAVTKIPKTTSGKIRHFQLLETYTEQRAGTTVVDAENNLLQEGWIAREVSALLGIPVNDGDDLLELGMNSLMAMQLCDRLSRRSGRALTVEALFVHTRINELARHLDQAPALRELPSVIATPPVSRYALSVAQRRLFTEYQLEPDSTAYHLPIAFLIKGSFELHRFQKSLAQAIARHDSLRTSFVLVGEEPYQQVHPYREEFAAIRQIDLRAVADRRTESDRLISAEVEQPFALQEPAAFRTTLIRLAYDQYLLLFVAHHIIVDGRSLDVVFREIFDAYNDKGAPGLPPFQYRDYVAWQAAVQRSEACRQDRAYWHHELRDLPEPARFSAALPSTDLAPLAGTYRCSFSATTARQLNALAHRYHTSPFPVLLALLHVLLHRYTGLRDLTIGFDTTGRINAELENIVGYTLQTLCLRSRVDPEESFAGLMARVQQKTLEAQDHQLYPFEQLAEDLRKGRPGNPLFQTLVLYQNFQQGALALNGCRLHRKPVNVPHAFTDLLLELEQGSGWQLTIHYNGQQYAQMEIVRLAQHLQRLIGAVHADDRRALCRYDFLSATEKRRFTRQVDISSSRRQGLRQPVHQLFESQAARTPEAVALRAGDQVLTYGMLNVRANRLAHWLLARGVGAEDRIGFLTRRDEHLVIALLGILKSGAAYVALDPEWPAARWQQVATDSGMTCLLTDDALFDTAQAAWPGGPVHRIDASLSMAETGNPPAFQDLHRLAYVIYTSGSTGKPKGVMIEHATLTEYVQQFAHYFNINSADVVIQQASVAFDTLVEEVFPALCSAASIVIAPAGGRDTSAFMDLVHQHSATVLSTTPLVLQELNRQADDRLSSLRVAISGGDVLQPFHIDQLCGRMRVYNTYGPSEATVCATYQPVLSPADAGSIGRAVHGRCIYLLDAQLELLPAGRVGEICIEGGLARGYLNQPQLTEERFVAPAFDPTKRVYRTGDLGRWTEEGRLVFLGRNDAQLKLNGHRTEPAEIEGATGRFPAVLRCAVVVSETQALHAFLVVRDDYQEPALRMFLNEQLPYYMIPRQFTVLDALPLTSTGKVDRQALAALIRDTEPTAYRAPAGEIEEGLAAIVASVLEIDKLGADDHFFSRGADSIKATRIQGLVLQKMGYALSLRDVFLYPTVALLAAQLAARPTVLPTAITPAPPAETYALSPVQKRLWLLCTLHKDTRAYNEGSSLLIEGPLDVARAERVCAAIVNGYEVMRTVFIQSAGEPRQLICPVNEHPLNFRFEDLRTDAHPEAAAQTWAEETIAAPFDLVTGPLYRLLLARIGDERYVFTIALHHLITDDWSASLILRAFENGYNSPGDYNVPPPPVEYKDYAYWAEQNLSSTLMERHRAYWKEQFREAPPVADLFPDLPRPAIKQDEGAVLHLRLEPLLHAALKELCQQEGISLFMCLLSAVGVLMHRYSGQDDLVIGTPVADRAQPSLKDLPGFLIHTLPLRLRMGKKDNLQSLWQQVKTVCLDAYAHQSYPLEALLEVLPATRDLSRSPLFDVIVNMGSAPSLPQLEGCRCQSLPRRRAGSKYDLEFYFEEEAGSLRLQLVYDRHLFCEERMTRLAGHLTQLLRLFTEDRQGLVSELNYLAPEEEDELYHRFNNTHLDVPERTAAGLFEEQARSNPEAIAIRCEDRNFSYREINRRADFLATRLCYYYGLEPAARVALLLRRNEQAIIAILGTWKSGATYVPIDPSLPEDRIRQLIAQSEVTLVITDEEHLPLCERVTRPGSARTVCISHEVPDRSLFDGEAQSATDSIAYMLFTSGSTGQPKGVSVPQRALTNLLYSLKEGLGLKAGGIMLSVSSYTFDISLSEFFLPLAFGGTLVLATAEEVLDARQLKNLVAQTEPDIMQGTPGLWRALVEAGWEGSPRLSAITCGEPLRPKLRDDLLVRTGQLWNLYGPTETTIFSTGTLIKNTEEPITIGRPLGNTTCFVLDRNGQPVPIGGQGQLHIGGRGLSAGYWQQPALTAEKFRSGWPFTKDRLYATGDLVRWLPDGQLEYTGRTDDQLKIRGFRIEPGEIETALLQCPGVRSAVVLPHRSRNDLSLAAFVAATGISTVDLANHLRAHLPAYMVPSHFVVTDHIPLTVNGKVNKAKLLLLLNDLPHETETAPPATRVEKLLARIWQEVLERNGFGIDDNFFDLGGHSLRANQVVNQIYHGLGVEVPLSDIFTHATIRQLSAHIDTLESGEYDITTL